MKRHFLWKQYYGNRRKVLVSLLLYMANASIVMEVNTFSTIFGHYFIACRHSICNSLVSADQTRTHGHFFLTPGSMGVKKLQTPQNILRAPLCSMRVFLWDSSWIVLEQTGLDITHSTEQITPASGSTLWQRPRRGRKPKPALVLVPLKCWSSWFNASKHKQ